MKKFILPFIFCVLLAFHCSEPIPLTRLEGYNLQVPDDQFVLPDTLHEISGITELDSVSFACVQDENGILFIYDAVKNEILAQHNFAGNGDYEGITRVNEVLYVLRSDGMLYEIYNIGKGKKLKTREYFTGIPAANNEGLCYDADHNRLLIGAKSKPGKGPEYKDSRVIYAFNLDKKFASRYPVYNFSVEKMIKFAVANNISLPMKKKGKNLVPFLKFGTSEIAINPVNKLLYLLSATDHMLFVFDLNGELRHIEVLDPVVFNKPEGVTFFKNGDMLITNEGQNKKPTLLRFNFKE